MLMCCLSLYFAYMFVTHVLLICWAAAQSTYLFAFSFFSVFTILFSPSNYRFSIETPHSWRCCFCRKCQQQQRYIPHINDVSFTQTRILCCFSFRPLRTAFVLQRSGWVGVLCYARVQMLWFSYFTNFCSLHSVSCLLARPRLLLGPALCQCVNMLPSKMLFHFQ